MNSNEQCDLYAEFEPEANEILFGQKTLPARPLTDKEKSKRKKILLKLLDQKLKFELIELMSRQQNRTIAQNASPIPTIHQINANESNVVDTANSTLASNHQSAGFQYYPSRGNFHENCQPQFPIQWQPPISYQQYETNRNMQWSNQNYGFQHNMQTWQSYHDRNKKPLINPNLIKAKTNVSSKNIKRNQSSSKFKKAPKSRYAALNQKPTYKEPSSLLSVNQSMQQSSTKDSFNPVFQIDLTKDDESLPLEPKSPHPSKIRSETMNSKFLSAGPSGLNNENLQPTNDPICQVFKSNDLVQQQTQKRKQASPSNADSRKKCLTVEQKPDAGALKEIGVKCDLLCKSTKSANTKPDCEVNNNLAKANTQIENNCKFKINNISGSMSNGKTDLQPNQKAIAKGSTSTVRRTDTKDKSIGKKTIAGLNAGTIRTTTSFKGHQICSQNSSTEWNMMNRLVTVICRNELNHIEPISPHQLKVKNEILIQMSINPDAIRSHTIIAQKMRGYKLEKFINQCKVILSNVNRAGPETQSKFSELRDKLIMNMKALILQRDTSDTTNKVQHLNLVQTEIANIIRPLLSSGNTDHSLIAKIIKNPHVLENNEMLKSRLAATNKCLNDVLKDIKEMLDSLIEARSPEPFFLPDNQYVDVPFAVKLYQKSGEMTEVYATELRRIIFDSINCLKVSSKPKIRDVKFAKGSLMMVCVNQKTFDWLQGTISNHLGVEILPVKNVIPKSDLKTVCMKFIDPQYLHFNELMEQLGVDNKRLLTRRWELRSPQFVDSTKCTYVGVDAESLVALEEMNCEVKLRGSLVYFIISYDEKEKNFERVDFVKQRKKEKKI